MTKERLQQALNPKRFLPCGGCGEVNPDKRCIGCGHLFAAIAQPVPPASAVVQEPDAWETQAGLMLKTTKAYGELYRWTPLYKHPQAAQPVPPATERNFCERCGKRLESEI